MCGVYSNILISMMDSYSSIISNSLSQIMKFLTSVTIILAVPTVIYSLWGANVPMPMENTPYGFCALLFGGLALTGIVTFYLWKKDML